MNDSRLMRRRKCIGDLACDAQDLTQVHRVARHLLAQGLSVNVFGGDEVTAVLHPNLMDGHDVGMVQTGSGISLALETGKSGLVLSECSREQLNGDLTTQAGIKG